MKTALLLISVLLCSSFNDFKKDESIYYFCTSRTYTNTIGGKKLVLLTEIKETNKGSQYINSQLSKWVRFVNKKNPSNCTSDLNNYKDEKRAKQELGFVKEMFNDTSKYVVEVVKL